MKILRVRGENLASLEAPFDVDLTGPELGHAGLFAITGPTGSGKSTLLDAICLCLYDKTPRLEKSGGAMVVLPGQDTSGALKSNDQRNILRRGAGQGWAVVDFMGRDGRQWSARWHVRRAKLDPAGRVQDQTVTLTDDQGNAVGHNKTETLAVIRERIGLDFDQFRRSVLLAQGDFAAFLKAKETDRAELLEQMTGTGIYTRLSQQAFFRARDLRGARKEVETRIEAQGVLGEDERAEAEKALEEATTQRNEAVQRKAAAETAQRWHDEQQKLTTEVAKAKTALDQAQAALDAAKDRRETFAQADAAWELRKDAQAADEALAKAAAADQAVAQATTDRDNAQQALDAAQTTLARARAAVAQEQQRLAEQLAERLDTATQALAEHQGWLGDNPLTVDLLATDRAVEDLVKDLRRARSLQAELALLDQATGDQAARDEKLKAQLEAARTAATQCAEQLQAAAQQRKQAQAAYNALDVGQLDRDRRELNLRREQLNALQALVQRAADLIGQRDAATKDRDDAAGTLTDAQQARCDADAALAQLSPRLDEAESALERARQAVDAEALRSTLVDGQPCPVCGGTDHPWADGSAVARLHEEQHARVADLRKQRDQAQQTRAKADAQATAATRQRDAADQRRAAAQTAVDGLAGPWADHAGLVQGPLPAGPTADGADAALQTLLADAQAEDAALRLREQAARTAGKARDVAQAACDVARGQAERANRALADADKAVTTAAGKADERAATRKEKQASLDTLRADLTDKLDPVVSELDALSGWPDAAVDDLAEGLATRRREVVRYDKRARLAQQAIDALKDRVPREAEAADRARQDVPTEDLASVHLPTAPAGLAPQDHSDWLEARLRDARVALRGAEGDHGSATRALATADTALATAQGVAKSARETADSRASDLARALADRAIDADSLARLRTLPDDWLATERAQLQALADAPRQADTLLEERLKRLDEHAADQPDVDADAATAALATAEAARETTDETWVQARSAVENDDRARAKVGALRDQLADHDRTAKPWLQLADCIGSGNGQEFRRFAQSLTLEALLEHANAQLRELRPRYSLARIHKTDLEIMVIDHDLGDEPRSVQSLSGGETFLASLALALGLSSLSSHDVRIESLFIDEGFGSLDDETLQAAMAMLEGLQASGRQVGVISHVAGLATTIGARVRIRPQGGGRSRVQVLAR